jgi:hypothetical protein
MNKGSHRAEPTDPDGSIRDKISSFFTAACQMTASPWAMSRAQITQAPMWCRLWPSKASGSSRAHRAAAKKETKGDAKQQQSERQPGKDGHRDGREISVARD